MHYSESDNCITNVYVVLHHVALPLVNYLCKDCKTTVQWNHEGFISICTSDNFLTLPFVYCKQFNKYLLSELGCSTVDDTLKAVITLMMMGIIYERRTVFICMLLSAVNLSISPSKLQLL